jgi:hypothetical protein
MINLYKGRLLSRRTVLDELQRGGVLDPDLRIDNEIERIEEEAPDESEKGVEPTTENPLALE